MSELACQSREHFSVHGGVAAPKVQSPSQATHMLAATRSVADSGQFFVLQTTLRSTACRWSQAQVRSNILNHLLNSANERGDINPHIVAG